MALTFDNLSPVLTAEAITLFVWVEWRPANTPARVAWRGPDEVPIAIEDGSRRLGVYVSQSVGGAGGGGTKPYKGMRGTEDDAAIEGTAGGEVEHGVRFLGCGYNVSVAGWQLVAVVRRSVERDSSSSSDAVWQSVRSNVAGAKERVVDYTFFVNGYRVLPFVCVCDGRAYTHSYTRVQAVAYRISAWSMTVWRVSRDFLQ
jgi:hypothetical protein